MGRRIALGLVTTALALAAAGCGAGEPGSTPATPDRARLYQADTIVLEDESHGPMLCLGGAALSLPPQCGDVPVVGWDWREVEGEETRRGTTWGSFHVVGTYDGTSFDVQEVGAFEGDPSSEPEIDFSSPCAEPKGGWSGLEQATETDVSAAEEYAGAQADYVASWVTQLDSSALVYNAVFTGDAERHEAAIRELWPGPLCVVTRDSPSARELDRTRSEVEAGLPELGLQMLWSQTTGVERVIEIGVVIDVNGKGQAELDERYGPGVVRLVSALEPA